jgi:hypothetical protein
VLQLLSFGCVKQYRIVTENNSLPVFRENSVKKNGSLVKDVKNMREVKTKKPHNSHRLSEYFVVLLQAWI